MEVGNGLLLLPAGCFPLSDDDLADVNQVL